MQDRAAPQHLPGRRDGQTGQHRRSRRVRETQQTVHLQMNKRVSGDSQEPFTPHLAPQGTLHAHAHPPPAAPRPPCRPEAPLAPPRSHLPLCAEVGHVGGRGLVWVPQRRRPAALGAIALLPGAARALPSSSKPPALTRAPSSGDTGPRDRRDSGTQNRLLSEARDKQQKQKAMVQGEKAGPGMRRRPHAEPGPLVGSALQPRGWAGVPPPLGKFGAVWIAPWFRHGLPETLRITARFSVQPVCNADTKLSRRGHLRVNFTFSNPGR